MKNYWFIKLLFLSTLFISEISFGQGKWWQREIPTPSANQMINPDYNSIRRELEVSLDEKNDLIKRYGHQKLSREQQMQYDYLLFLIDSKMTRLEEELKGTSMYIENPNFNNSNTNIQTTNQENNQNVITDRSYSNSNPNNNSNASSTSSNSYLLTIYKIKNYNKNIFKNDIERNSESLNLFNEIKSRLDEIVYHEYKEISYYSSDIDKFKAKIQVYETFINNWGKSIGTDEAKEEINGFNKQIEDILRSATEEKLRIEKEKNLSELKEKTDVIARFHFIGDLEPIIQVYKGYRCFAYIFNIILSIDDDLSTSEDESLQIFGITFCGQPPTVKNLYSKGYGCDTRDREVVKLLKNYFDDIYLKKSINLNFNYTIEGYNYDKTQILLDKKFQIESITVNPKRKTYIDINVYFSTNTVNDIRYKITYE